MTFIASQLIIEIYAVSLGDIDFTFVIDGQLSERDGHQYLTVNNIDFNPTIGSLKLQATGLLPEPSLSKSHLHLFIDNLIFI